jgi:hypothetical protein
MVWCLVKHGQVYTLALQSFDSLQLSAAGLFTPQKFARDFVGDT